jgi:hypothetical protein
LCNANELVDGGAILPEASNCPDSECRLLKDLGPLPPDQQWPTTANQNHFVHYQARPHSTALNTTGESSLAALLLDRDRRPEVCLPVLAFADNLAILSRDNSSAQAARSMERLVASAAKVGLRINKRFENKSPSTWYIENPAEASRWKYC